MKKRTPRCFFTLAVLVGLMSSALARGDVLTLDNTDTDVAPRFHYWIDKSGSATIEDFQAVPAAQLKAAGDRGVTLGFTPDPLWLTFDVRNAREGQLLWLLLLSDPLLDDVQVFLRRGERWRTLQGGDHHAGSPDVVDAISPVFPLELKAGQTHTVALRIQSLSSMLVEVRLMTPERFFQTSMLSFLGYGALFGIMGAMCLYNLFLYASLRDSNYLLYVASICFTGLFLGSLSGHAPKWLWPEYRSYSEGIFLWIVAFTLVFGLLFCTRFLEAKRFAPGLHRTILILIGLAIATIPLSMIAGFQSTVQLTGAVSATSGTIGIVTAATCLARGNRSARFYLAAWAGYCIGTVFTAARQHGWVDNSFVTVHGMEYGAVLETVLISFALSDRFNQLQASNDRAQKEANESLRRMDRLKDEFLANTSHELRTPLQGIIGIAESMRNGATGELTDQSRRNLDLIISSGNRLASLVGDILDYSKMRSNELRLHLTPVDLHVAADVVLRLTQPLAASKGLTLVNEIDRDSVRAVADENRLQQILHNLIGNAVKFTDTGSVRLRARESDGRIRVEVVDTGPGIAEADQQRIFESFEQLEESSTRVHGGTGLGLAVTRQLVALHGGQVGVQSVPGNGATFYFDLAKAEQPELAAREESTEVPAAEPSSPLPLAAPELADDLRAVAGHHADSPPKQIGVTLREGATRILVVDDEPINQEVMQNQLVMHDYEVIQASDGVRALQLLSSGEHFDLILLDVMMPRLSGFEVCREIRKSLLPTEMPILMVTARAQAEDLQVGLEAGANDYITKPVNQTELLSRIRTQLSLLRIYSAYSHYVPYEFLRYLGKQSILDVRLGDNVEMEAAILVSDIRQFTTLSEAMTPDENFEFINDYFAHVSPPVRNHAGFIDRYTGDSVMAVFPLGPDDALKAAHEMLDKLTAFNAQRQRQGQPAVQIGIGLHVGKLRLGVVGEFHRRQGDIFSDAVNVANRIETMTKDYGATILMSDSFCRSLSDHGASIAGRRELGEVVLRGKSQKLVLHEVYQFDPPDIRAAKNHSKARFEAAVHLMSRGDGAAALAAFEALALEHSTDRAVGQLLRQCGGTEAPVERR